MKPANYTSKSLDHLGLIAVLCKDIGIAEQVDKFFPNQSPHKHISYGNLLVAMLWVRFCRSNVAYVSTIF